ncbi:hypothetical protein GGU11DRAFT_751837 [Lentinula aff. detonsa]|nr:hypothetical protein GGU11DRAFT_751837 [Lentinula aff. detonsa]
MIMETNASNYTLAAILLIVYHNGEIHPVAFLSQTFQDRAGLANPLSSVLKIPGNSPMGCPNLMGCPNHLQIPCLVCLKSQGCPNLMGCPNFSGMSQTWDVPISMGCPKPGMSQFLWDVPNLGCPNFNGMSQTWDVPISLGCPKPGMSQFLWDVPNLKTSITYKKLSTSSKSSSP